MDHNLVVNANYFKERKELVIELKKKNKKKQVTRKTFKFENDLNLTNIVGVDIVKVVYDFIKFSKPN